MVSNPTVRYLIGGAEQPVIPGSSLWESPLPMDRLHFQRVHTDNLNPSAITHGVYFAAARQFLEKDRFHLLSSTLGVERFQEISDIRICLMKHGAYYHPARIVASTDRGQQSFVLNMAVSDPGRRIIKTEIAALKRLYRTSVLPFVPKVYGEGSVVTEGNQTLDMFLGEWFEGYGEFHLSRNTPDAVQRVCVWGELDSPFFLSTEEEYLLYHHAARILTSCYNLSTTEHISCWHHASGDFIVKAEAGRMDVKLITVRHYGPLLQKDEASPDMARENSRAMDTLLLFFLGLSIRMRLDRLDGIGDFVWAEDTAVVGTWTGFLEGLTDNHFFDKSQPNPAIQFERHLSTYSISDLRNLADEFVDAVFADPDEKAVVEKHIGQHMETLCEVISRIGFA